MNRNIIVSEARRFAHLAHGSIDQRRKYTNAPYVVHTDGVASRFTNPIRACMANLHDVSEDVEPFNIRIPIDICESFGLHKDFHWFYNLEAIREIFGNVIALGVDDLTDRYTKERYPELNRRARKDRERIRQAQISTDAKTVKLADCIDNGRDILVNDPNFAINYIREIRMLAPLLYVESDPENVALSKELNEILFFGAAANIN